MMPDPIEDRDANPAADAALRQQIEEALDMIRPYLMADGGSVRLLNITADHVVELELLGACGTCPMSTMTLRAGIEQALKRTIPQISRVEAISASAAA
ncbi:MAG: NifU family protein [Rhodothermales bacterium]